MSYDDGLFERLNPKIDGDFLRLKFPTNSSPWPSTGLRRASISSFGYGGSNSHIVLDDAYNYLRLRGLQGRHFTKSISPSLAPSQHVMNGTSRSKDVAESEDFSAPLGRLLVWSSSDKSGLQRIVEQYQNEDTIRAIMERSPESSSLRDLAFTLYNHKNHLQWRSFAILSSIADFDSLSERVSVPFQTPATAPRIGFVFTGQGAQWYAMGRELIAYPSFQEELDEAGSYLKSIGCSWSLSTELFAPEAASRIDNPELSQALCTVLQIAIVNLLHRFGVSPHAVVGHSSGEIAAAYASGNLSRESAWRLAFLRGLLSSELCDSTHLGPSGAMMAVNLSKVDAEKLIEGINDGAIAFGVSVACVNSPTNVTLSGEEKLIDVLKSKLDSRNVTAKKLRVKTAYHSRQMEAISARYISSIGSLSGNGHLPVVPMVSTVTGDVICAANLRDPGYWSLNMVSTVEFSDALARLCAKSPADLVKKIDRSHVLIPSVNHLLEIGPHAALQGPIRDILRTNPRGNLIGYDSVLRRGHNAVDSLLRTLGSLHCQGSELDFMAINCASGSQTSAPSMIADLPEYPFDHSQRYWHESRLSRNYRLREHAPSELLGVRTRDWNDLDARWTHFLRTTEMPWMEQHVVNGITLYPGAGMLVMAIEAANELHTNYSVEGFTLQEVYFETAMSLDASEGSLEVQTSLKRSEVRSGTGPRYDFTIRSHTNGGWTDHCRGVIAVEMTTSPNAWTDSLKAAHRQKITQKIADSMELCDKAVDYQHMYSFLKRSGYEFGPVFQAAQEQRCDEPLMQASAQIQLYASSNEKHIVHPVSLDATLHLCFTSFTAGGLHPMATSVPSYIGSLWISSTGLSKLQYSSVASLLKVTSTNSRGFSCEGGAISTGAEPQLRLWIEGLVLTNVTSLPRSVDLPDPKQFCMNIEQKPALDKLTNSDLLAYLNEMHPVTDDSTSFFQGIGHLIKMTLERLLESIDFSQLGNLEPWKERYRAWAQYQLTQGRLRDFPATTESFQDLCDRLMSANNVGRLYVAVARHIEALMRDETTPLDLLMQTGLLREYYKDLAEYRSARQSATYLSLLAHQKPGLRILEVGGGTAGATRGLLHALSLDSYGNAGSTLRCDRYDFTDVSSAFAEKARESFARYHAQMTFGVLDIEQDFATQGYGEGEYDVVVADNVLHIAADLKQTLQNVRKSLKPGGKLIMPELLKPDGWTAGFVFGVFPGWWLGSVEERPLSPNLSSYEWGTILESNGFAGSELVLTDFDGPAHHLGCIISTAVAETPLVTPKATRNWNTAIIVQENCGEQQRLASLLSNMLSETFQQQASVTTLEKAVSIQQDAPVDLYVLLLDYESSFFGGLHEQTWIQLQRLIESSRRILWISSGGGPNPSPVYGMVDGLARTLRSEYYELHLVTMALDPSSVDAKFLTHVRAVVDEMTCRLGYESYEQEYAEINGLLQSRRLVDADYLKLDLESQLVPYKTVSKRVDKIGFQISLEKRDGAEADPFFIQAPGYSTPPELDDIDILVGAFSFTPQDRSFHQSRDMSLIAGTACAGTISRAGPLSTFRPGDRVFAASASSLCSELRTSSRSVILLPDTLSFCDASWAINPLLVAYHAMIEIAHASKGDTVLVDDGYSLLGRAAIRLLAQQGIKDIWTTAESEKESAWISENLPIALDRIVPNEWFDREPMLISHLKEKFDIALCFRDESKMPYLYDCVRNGAQILRTRHSLSLSATSHRRNVFLKPVSLSIIDSVLNKPSTEALQYAAEHIEELVMKSSSEQQVLTFRASELTDAMHNLRHTTSGANVVIDLDRQDTITVRVPKSNTHNVRPNATYVIAGGLGGLGRAMARWLASRGARCLILLSRNGIRTAEAQDLARELHDQGVYCETPACNIADRDVLQAVLTDCMTRMPPIRGCIQASMVMTERIFQQMSFADWKTTVEPKVEGSWNLHEVLPQDLDFFILISSMMGILGSGSLAAYNAGNTYKDMLAHYRVANGQRAVSLNLGAVPDGGYLVSNTDHLAARQHVLDAEKFALTHVKDLCGLLEIFCRPDYPMSLHNVGCQAVIGIRPPAHWKHIEEVPAPLNQPFWGHMHHIPMPPEIEQGISVPQNPSQKPSREAVESLVAAGALTEAAAVASEALALRVSSLLGVTKDRLDTQKPMHSYGLDSLSSIEIRNWIGQVFNVDLPVFIILGGATISSAASTIVSKI